jgi:hypothetical protein
VILLDDLIQVLDLSNPDGRFPLSVDALEGTQIGRAFIHGHGLGRAVTIDVDHNEVVTDPELKTSIRVSGAKIPFKIIGLRVAH